MVVVLEELLADQLALAIAVGRQPDPLAVHSASWIALSFDALLLPLAGRVS